MTVERLARPPLCTICRFRRTRCAPGLALLEQLAAVMRAGGAAFPETFEMSGGVDGRCGGEICPLAFHLSARRVYVFGDVSKTSGLEELIALADSMFDPPDAAGPPGAQATIEDGDAAQTALSSLPTPPLAISVAAPGETCGRAASGFGSGGFTM